VIPTESTDSPSPRRVIATIVAICGYGGWQIAIVPCAWFVTKMRPLELRHFIVSIIVVAGMTFGGAALFAKVDRARAAMQESSLSRGQITLCIGIAILLATALAGGLSLLSGFRGWYMGLPLLAAPFGAWLGAILPTSSRATEEGLVK
jgi:hypothetical protein